jgi:CBS domain-containing protein
MRHSIMTEKIARRGVRVPDEYAADFLEQVTAGDQATREVVTLRADDTLATVRAWMSAGDAAGKHQGYPVVDAEGHLVGVLTRRDLLESSEGDERRVRELVRRAPAVIFEDSSLREAADVMVLEDIGRLPVVAREAPDRIIGILSRSDLLRAHRRRLLEHQRPPRVARA